MTYAGYKPKPIKEWDDHTWFDLGWRHVTRGLPKNVIEDADFEKCLEEHYDAFEAGCTTASESLYNQ